MNLKDLEEYIIRNGHLPEIPTAREIEENGVLVSEMINKLLKKNEELTLHLIEKNKQIEKQEDILENLSERLKNLERKIVESN